MLIVSLMLAGLAIAISTGALAIAVAHDLRDRDRRIHSRQRSGRPVHTAQLPLRLWVGKTTHSYALLEGNGTADSARPRAPDIIVGHCPAASDAPATDRVPPRKAA